MEADWQLLLAFADAHPLFFWGGLFLWIIK